MNRKKKLNQVRLKASKGPGTDFYSRPPYT